MESALNTQTVCVLDAMKNSSFIVRSVSPTLLVVLPTVEKIVLNAKSVILSRMVNALTLRPKEWHCWVEMIITTLISTPSMSVNQSTTSTTSHLPQQLAHISSAHLLIPHIKTPLFQLLKDVVRDGKLKLLTTISLSELKSPILQLHSMQSSCRLFREATLRNFILSTH